MLSVVIVDLCSGKKITGDFIWPVPFVSKRVNFLGPQAQEPVTPIQHAVSPFELRVAALCNKRLPT